MFYKISGWTEQGAHTVTTQGLVSSTTVQQSYGAATITVYNAGTLTPSTIYSDGTGTPKANPFTASATGYWSFYVPAGSLYDVRLSGGGIATPFTLSDMIAIGSGGGGGGTIDGSGTINRILKLTTSATTVGNSLLSDDGNKVINDGITQFIGIPAPNGAQGNTSTALMMRGADSSSGTPANSDNPSGFFETVRTGGTNGVARFGWNYHYQVTGASAADNYPHYLYFELAPNMSGAPAGGYFHEGERVYMLAAPTNIAGGQNIHGYAKSVQAERLTAGWRLIAEYVEIRNTTATDANPLDSSIDTTYNFVTSIGGTSHNTGLWFAEGPSNTTSAYYGAKFGANSICQRGLDTSAAIFTLQGTWTATNGSPTIAGVGGHADVEVVAGDWLLVNGTRCRAASATANAITLMGNFAGSTSGSLTITKPVQTMWTANSQPIAMALNAAGTAKKEFARITEADKWKFDEDAIGALFGASIGVTTNLTANNGFTQKAYVGAVGGQEQFPGIWFGAGPYTTANASFLYESSLNATILNGATGIYFRVGNVASWDISTAKHFIADTDNAIDIGQPGANRPRSGYFGTSVVIAGPVNVTTFTPTGSADAAGSTGDIRWDSGFVYVKTGAGAWKRSALSAF